MRAAVFILGIVFIGLGALVLFRFSGRPEIRRSGVSPNAVGLPLIALGLAVLVIASVVQPGPSQRPVVMRPAPNPASQANPSNSDSLDDRLPAEPAAPPVSRPPDRPGPNGPPAERPALGQPELVRKDWRPALRPGEAIELDTQRVVPSTTAAGDVRYPGHRSLEQTGPGFWSATGSDLSFAGCRERKGERRSIRLEDVATGAVFCTVSSDDLIAALRIDRPPVSAEDEIGLTLTIWRP